VTTEQPFQPLTHPLKVWPRFIPALADGSKTFEARRDDRNFQIGDTLSLYGWDPDTGLETGWRQTRTVTYKLSGPAFGIEADFCILGLLPLPVARDFTALIRKLCESMYRDGFQNGANHGNLDWKYPPEDIAWLQFKRQQSQLFGDKAILTREELAQIAEWEDQSYAERTRAANTAEDGP
jgi:hypothetical protein